MAAYEDFTLEELKQFRRELVAARATGARTVRHGDKMTSFREDAEMSNTLGWIEDLIAQKQGKKRPSATFATFDRGVGR